MYRTAQTRAAESESTRLFYVATTRAARLLILSSSIKDIAEPSQAWTKLLAERFDLQTGACLAPVAEITPPHVRVTTYRAAQTGKDRHDSWQEMAIDVLADLPTVSIDLKQAEVEQHRRQPVVAESLGRTAIFYLASDE